MKYLLTYIVILCLAVRVSAQPADQLIDTYQGPELSLASDVVVPGIFGHDEKGYYSYFYDYRPGLVFLDKEFREVRRNHIDLVDGLHGRNLLGVVHFHDTIYLFTTAPKLKSMLLFVETINKETLLQNGDRRLLLKVPNLAGWESDFGYRLSRQQDKLLIYSRLDVLSKNIQEVQLLMFGRGFNLEWETSQKIIYPRSPPRKSIIKISDEGDVYFVSLLDEQNLRSVWDGIKNRYHLIAVTEYGQVANSYALMLPDLYIRGVMIEPGEDHKLVCAGFYSPTHFRGNVDGIFYFELDNRTGVFRNQSFHEFDPGVLREAIAEKYIREPDELFEFRPRQLIRRANGNFILLAENQYDQNFDTYQNLIAACFTPGGTLKWTRVIKKRQNIDVGSPLNYSSYCVHAPKNSKNVHLLFNDRDKNEYLPAGARPKTFHPNSLANLKVVTLGPSGETTSSIIYRKTKKRMKTPIPLQYYDKLNNEMVIPMLRWKRYNYMGISFKE